MKWDRHYYKMQQLFNYKMRQRFITKCVTCFITKCNSFITKCDSHYKMCHFYCKMPHLLQNASTQTEPLHPISYTYLQHLRVTKDTLEKRKDVTNSSQFKSFKLGLIREILET